MWIYRGLGFRVHKGVQDFVLGLGVLLVSGSGIVFWV